MQWSPVQTKAKPVIIHTHDYINKVHSFLSENFHTIPNDPTTEDHNTILKILQECERIFNNKQIKYITQKNPILTHAQHPTKAAQT